MANQHVLERFQQQYEAVRQTLPGDSGGRARALEQLLKNGLPNRKTERWRYTRLNSVLKQEFAPASSATNQSIESAVVSELLAQMDTPVLLFEQGCFRADLSTTDDLGGVQFKPLGEALASGDLALPEPATGADRAFEQLNSVLVADGAWLKFPAGKQPLITLVVVADNARAAEQASYLRLVIEAESLCEAELAIVYVATDQTDQSAPYHANHIIDIELATGAQLALSQLQLQGEQAFHITGLRANLHRDSRFKTHVLALGGGISRDDLDINLGASGAHVEVDGLQLTGGHQHADLHLTIDHAAPHCTSRVSHHGLFAGHGRGVFNGRVHVLPGADGTDSDMSSSNLLLSDTAEIDAKPELEIYADDVKCSHGTTVGDINQDELFYLRSRGLAEAPARALLLHAFAAASFSALAGQWGALVAERVGKKLERLSHE